MHRITKEKYNTYIKDDIMSYKKLELHKMDLKDLTTKNLWDGQWLETKYPDKFKKNEKR